MSKMTNIYLISSIGTSLNKGLPKDFSFFSFLFFWAFQRKKPFIIMYVNINRYYKIYYKYPPSIIYLPRANARKKRKEKKEKFAPRSVKICETTLTFLLFFFFFGSFFCYCRNFSVIFTLGEDTFVL